jgi:hypothetical protein
VEYVLEKKKEVILENENSDFCTVGSISYMGSEHKSV